MLYIESFRLTRRQADELYSTTSEYTASQKRPLSIVEQLSQLDARQSLVVTHPATPRRRLLIIVDSSVNCLYAYFMPFRRYSVTKNKVWIQSTENW